MGFEQMTDPTCGHALFGGACLLCSCASFALSLAGTVVAYAEPIHVRYRQGSTHGFVTLQTMDGKSIATGEVTQTVRGGVVSSRLVFHFRHGSVDDDLTVFRQSGSFRLLKDHHIQHGPSFPKAIDVLIDATTGQITSRADDETVKGQTQH